MASLETFYETYFLFYIDTDFVFISYMFCAGHLSFWHLIDRGGRHAWGREC